jgi:hypothetical protein
MVVVTTVDVVGVSVVVVCGLVDVVVEPTVVVVVEVAGCLVEPGEFERRWCP